MRIRSVFCHKNYRKTSSSILNIKNKLTLKWGQEMVPGMSKSVPALCPKRTKYVFNMLRHIREVYRRPPRTDPFCQSDLELHECNNCEFTTCLNVSLKNHNDVMHKNLQVDHRLTDLLEGYCCKKCDLHTFSIFIWARHVCRKSRIIEESQMKTCFTCGDCQRQFTRKYNLKLHIRNKHTPEERIKWVRCEQCSYKCKSMSHLKVHIINRHSLDEHIHFFQCEQCSYKAKENSNLKQHIKNKHTLEENIKWFKCTQCSYKGKKMWDLKRHTLRKHSSEENIYFFQCEHCSFKTKINWQLKSHIRNMHTSEENIN